MPLSRPALRTLLPLLLTALGAAGCASALPLPDSDRAALSREWEGKILFARSTLNVLPFFADTTRRLLTPLPADSIHLLDDSKGAPILPGAVEQVVPMGTKVRIEKVEFPTGLVRTRRPLFTPRQTPWVYVSLPGFPRGRPYIAVLRANLASREDFAASLMDLFSEDEPSLWLKNASPSEVQAIVAKRLVAGMNAEAVQLAWGRPERIHQEVERPGSQELLSSPSTPIRTETWTWPLGKRTATFRDGKLVSAAPALERP